MSFFEKLKNFDHAVFIYFMAFIKTKYPWILMALWLVAYDVHTYLTVNKFDSTMLYMDLPTILLLLLQAYIVSKKYNKKNEKK